MSLSRSLASAFLSFHQHHPISTRAGRDPRGAISALWTSFPFRRSYPGSWKIKPQARDWPSATDPTYFLATTSFSFFDFSFHPVLKFCFLHVCGIQPKKIGSVSDSNITRALTSSEGAQFPLTCMLLSSQALPSLLLVGRVSFQPWPGAGTSPTCWTG